MLELIILDLFGTIVPIDSIGSIFVNARAGLLDFLEFYRNIRTVVSSDILRREVERTLRKAGLAEKFQGVYGREDMIFAGFGRGIMHVKDLGKVCRDLGVNRTNAALIGDNFVGRDERSAETFGISFTRVPQYRIDPPTLDEMRYQGEWVEFENQQQPFSFKSLIGTL